MTAAATWFRACFRGWSRGVGDWMFAAKTAAAALAALYIGFSLDLPRPYWAAGTVFIVSQPLAGAMRSKGVFRVLGTVIGAVATVVIIPNLVDAPPLLCVAMALWTMACLTLALLDRTPRSYVFMLAAYSTALIGFPTVTDPGTVFDAALARVEEITVGILCATVIGSVIFPRGIGPVITGRIDAFAGDVGRWAREALSGAEETTAIRSDRRRLAADAVELQMMATHLDYDTSTLHGLSQEVRRLRQRLVMLLPILSGVGDRVRALKADGGLPAPLAELLADLADWVDDVEAPAEIAAALRTRIAALRAAPADWRDVLILNLLTRLKDLMDAIQDCRDLRLYIRGGGHGPRVRRRRGGRAGAEVAMHRDLGMALWSGAGAALTILLGSVFWIGTEWADGAIALEMAAVACCFFAAQDNPVPAILDFALFNGLAAILAGIYIFAIMPRIDGFVMLALVLGPLFLLLGRVIANPRLAGRALAVGATLPTLAGLSNTYSADFASYLNSALALVLGMGFAGLVTALVRAVGAEWGARRILRACWADIRAVADIRAPAPDGGLRPVFAGKLLDRMGLLVPRLAALPPGSEVAAADALADIRTGINILELRAVEGALPTPARAAADAVLADLAWHYDAVSRAGAPRAPSPALLARIDAALAALMPLTDRRPRQALLALAGIRRALSDGVPDLPPPPPVVPLPPKPESLAA
ncbi:FUSC family protein [Nitrospirillum sp. BR 11828]|uniref:FUSC family protein n=1 Tax=Nitrospirillum sp. BR 11828 TaxID=3104325 RepID=UPI002ACA073E|nr:FUSC family protein [Nitrospirillum sp. BR 11828]MDZ5650255.1 FUSC family protein [Nitrospirillum sp. BR 11828]